MAGAEAAAHGARRGGQTIKLINEAAGNRQRRIERKQPGQAFRLFRVNFFDGTGQPPGAPDAVAGLGRRIHRRGWRVVQKAAEAVAAEFVVLAGEQNELVPGIIDHLRGHRNHAPAGNAADLKVVAQADEYFAALLGSQFRSAFRQPLVEPFLVGKIVDERRSPLPAPVAPEQDGDGGKGGDDDELEHAASR